MTHLNENYFRKLPLFTEILEKVTAKEKQRDYSAVIATMEAVKNLYSAVAGSELAPNYEEYIDIFTNCWTEMTKIHDISTPNKVHIISTHIKEYISLTNQSLNQVSDQHVEAAHARIARLERTSKYERKLKNSFTGWLALKSKISHANGLNFSNYKEEKKGH